MSHHRADAVDSTRVQEARPDRRRIWAYRRYRDNSRLTATPGTLIAVGYDGATHEFTVGGSRANADGAARLVLATTSHLGGRGSVWREPRIIVVNHHGDALLSMRSDGYRQADVRQVAAIAGLHYSEHWFGTASARDASFPPAPGLVQLDVASRTFKMTLMISLIIAAFCILAGLVVVSQSS